MKGRRDWRLTLWSLIGLGLLLGFDPTAATAGSVSLTWDPNPEADLAGYKVYVGTASGSYSQTVDVGQLTTCTVSNLSEGQTFFFAVTAYDIFANESGYSDEVSSAISLSNSPPSALFTFSCSDLTCSFTDTSTDSDGSVIAWSWDFGEGTSSAKQSPSVTYASAGTYTATLGVTDDDGAIGTVAQDITVASNSSGGITLSAMGYKVRGLQKADLSWNGPTSSTVDIYRNGTKITTPSNNGSYTDHINKRGKGTYTYQVCEAGTSTCSNKATVAKFK